MSLLKVSCEKRMYEERKALMPSSFFGWLRVDDRLGLVYERLI